MLESIEDCLEHLVFNTTKNVLLEDDVTIVTSIAIGKSHRRLIAPMASDTG